MAIWGKFSPIPHPWTNFKVFTTFISYQFDAFFSNFYTLKHKNFLRIRKHWWHLQAEHAFINKKCTKMGYNRIYQTSNTCVFVLVECLHCFNCCTPGIIIYGPISSRCMGIAPRWNYNGEL